MRVAAVQLTTSQDLADNRRRVADVVRTAAGQGAALVVLPEATMCAFGSASFDLSAVAEALDGPFVDTLARVAHDEGVTVVAGMFERSDQPGRAYNTVVAVGPGGMLGAYRKVHLFDALGARESDRVVPGDPGDGGLLTFAMEGFVVGVMTCYDLRFPEIARALADRGATVLALPAHWYNGPGKAEVWETLVRARAIENTAYVVAAGKPEDEAVGRSAVVDPLGVVVGALGGKDEDVLVADLSSARVSAVRTMLPLLEHRRFGIVAR